MIFKKTGNSNFPASIEKKFGDKERQKWESKAGEYLEDPKKAQGLLDKAVKKAGKTGKGPLGAIWDKVQLLFDLVRNWISGTYRAVSKGTILLVIAGLVYFVAPLDMIPDFIPGLGYIDDATVLGFIIKQINKEIEKFREWRREKER